MSNLTLPWRPFCCSSPQHCLSWISSTHNVSIQKVHADDYRKPLESAQSLWKQAYLQGWLGSHSIFLITYNLVPVASTCCRPCPHSHCLITLFCLGTIFLTQSSLRVQKMEFSCSGLECPTVFRMVIVDVLFAVNNSGSSVWWNRLNSEDQTQ